MSIYGDTWEEDVQLPGPRAFSSMVMVPRWGMWAMGGLPAESMARFCIHFFILFLNVI